MKELNHPNINHNVGRAQDPANVEIREGDKTLLIGIGNSGRGDDGLGWAFVEAIEKRDDFFGETLLRYQLQVEDADLISQYDQVIFVDAFQGGLTDGFLLKPCIAAKDFSFTTHRLPPETVIYLCQELYHKNPKAYLLLIDGEKWELEIGLSEIAEQNLQNALAFFTEEIIAKELAET